MRRFFNIVVYFFALTSIYAKDIRVSTIAELYQSVNKLKPGDRLLLQDGIYNNIQLVVLVSGLHENPVHVTAENPGKVHFTGDAKVELRGENIVLRGIYFKEGARNINVWKSHGPGLVAIYGSYNRVTECMFNNFDEANSAYITTSLTQDGKVPVHCRIDHCGFVNKLTFDQVINLNNTFKKDTINGGPAMYHRIDHCFFSNPKKEGNAGGGIRIGYYRNDIGRCIIDSNVFVRQDSEPEIITGKSQENIYYANTFLNCRGTLNFRHGDNQVAINNFFISTDSLFEYGGMFIWGSGHLIANNYFNLKKTIKSRGNAAIYLNPGAPASEHAMAFDVKIIKNIFDTINGHAIHFAPMLANRLLFFPNLSETEMLPRNIFLENNCFKEVGNGAFPVFNNNNPSENRNIKWLNNACSGKVTVLRSIAGLKVAKAHTHLLPLLNCIDTIICAACKKSVEQTYKDFGGINFNFSAHLAGGIQGKPLQMTDILPAWMITETGTYYKNGKLTSLLQQGLKRINDRN